MSVSIASAIPWGILIGTGIVAISYMLASATNSRKLKAYSKSELTELLMASLIALLLVEAYGSSTLQGTLVGNSKSSATGPVLNAIDNKMFSPLNYTLNSLTYSSYSLSKYISYNFNTMISSFAPISFQGSDSPSAGASPISMQLSNAINTTALNLLLVESIRTLYLFLSFMFTSFLMPLGILLRFIPPSRKIGGLILGIGLSIHLVFPVAVLWSTSLGDSFIKTTNLGFIKDPGNPPTAGLVCSQIFQTAFSIGDLFGAYPLCTVICAFAGPFFAACYGGTPGYFPYDILPVCTSIVDWLWGAMQFAFPIQMSSVLESSDLVLSPDKAEWLYHLVVDNIMPTVIERNLAVLIMVILQLASTVILARAFAQVLGSDAQILGIGRLI